MKAKLTIAHQDFINTGETVEVIIDTLHHDRGLMTIIDGKCLIFDTFCGNFDLRELAYLRQYWVVSSNGLSFYGHYFQLWIEGSEKGGHKIVKAIEYTECNHKGHRCNSDTYDGDGADDIDGIGGFLRKEIPTGYEEREIHLILFFQKFVDTFDVVEAVVDKEAQLGDDAQLISHART